MVDFMFYLSNDPILFNISTFTFHLKTLILTLKEYYKRKMCIIFNANVRTQITDTLTSNTSKHWKQTIKLSETETLGIN